LPGRVKYARDLGRYHFTENVSAVSHNEDQKVA